MTTSVCRFLDLDPVAFDDYEFSVENKSRKHRSSLLRTLASRTNEMAEPLLNRFPGKLGYSIYFAGIVVMGVLGALSAWWLHVLVSRKEAAEEV